MLFMETKRKVMSNSQGNNNTRASHGQSQTDLPKTPNPPRATPSSRTQFPPNIMPGFAPPPPQYASAIGATGSTLADNTPITYDQYMNLMVEYRVVATQMTHYAEMMKNQQQHPATPKQAHPQSNVNPQQQQP